MGGTLGRGLTLAVLLAGCGARSSLDTGDPVGDAQARAREAAAVARDAEHDAGRDAAHDAGRDAERDARRDVERDARRDAERDASCTTPPPLVLAPSGCPDAGSNDTILVAAWMDGGLRNYSNCDPVTAAGTTGTVSDDIVTAGPAVTMFFVSAPTTRELAVVSVGRGGPLHVPWYCAGPGSQLDAAAPTRLVALRALGTCAEAPEVPGGIRLSGDQYEITLNGRTTRTFLGGGELGPTFFSTVIGYTPLGFIEAIFDPAGRLLSGSVLFTDLGPDPGAVYCITSGRSSVHDGLPGDYSLGGLRRLGSCAEAQRMPSCDEILIGFRDQTGP